MTERKAHEEAVTDFDAVEEDVVAGDPKGRVYLVVTVGDEPAKVIDVPDGATVSVGRTSENTIALDDSRVSRRHATIARTGADLDVRDLGSRNGTKLNGGTLRGESHRAKGGDVVRVGPAEIVIAAVRQRVEASADALLPPDVEGVVVADPEMRRVFGVARKLGRTQTTVLILGETGVGKEVVAEQIHRSSARASAPFVRLSCASLPENLLESELFGYERGAFTGADKRKTGYVESANGGTLLLDEIGEMTPGTQVKLLRVLASRAVTRLGGTQEIPVDVRILSATHRDLDAEVKAGRFREDLFYRISTFTLTVPPLRDRPADIPLLTDLFAREVAEKMEVTPPIVAPDAMRVLAAHRWPGNVRELRNAIEHAVVLAEQGVIRPEHLPPSVRGVAGASPAGALREEIASVEKKNIEAALAAENGNQTRAAVRLGISRRALVYKLAKYRIAR